MQSARSATDIATFQKLLGDAEAADPTLPDIYYVRGALASRTGDKSTVIATIKKLQLLGKLDPGAVSKFQNFSALLRDAGFQQSLKEVVGNATMEKIQGSLTNQAIEKVTANARVRTIEILGYINRPQLNKVTASDDGMFVCVDSKGKNGFGHVFQHLYNVWHVEGAKSKWIAAATNDRKYWDLSGCEQYPDYTSQMN